MPRLLRCQTCRLSWFPQGGPATACPACGGSHIGGHCSCSGERTDKRGSVAWPSSRLSRSTSSRARRQQTKTPPRREKSRHTHRAARQRSVCCSAVWLHSPDRREDGERTSSTKMPLCCCSPEALRAITAA